MELLMNLFSCGRATLSRQRTACLPRLAKPCNNKILTSTDSANKTTEELAVRTISTFSQPTIIIEPSLFKIPETRYIALSQSLNDINIDVNWGFLIGVINPSKESESFISPDAIRLKIGPLEQLCCVSAIRRYALDTLVVFWSQIGDQISVKDIISIDQPLVIVFTQNHSLEKFLLKYDQQLKLELGELCLMEGLQKIDLHIFKKSGKYMVERRKNYERFQKHFRQVLKKQGFSLDQKKYARLLELMTLNDYVDLKASKKQAVQRVTNYQKQIDRQIQLEKANEILPCYSQSLSPKTSSENKPGNKFSDYELQYFSPKNTGPKRQQKKQQNQQDLEIYYFNNTSENQQSSENEGVRTSNKIIIRNRSRSLDATYEVDEFLDDEFFEKYV